MINKPTKTDLTCPFHSEVEKVVEAIDHKFFIILWLTIINMILNSGDLLKTVLGAIK